ncbi:MAG: GNAT family N-acetyltransferase [Bacteroidia bacterium]|nr:GNAT family N-acetyltransferase [Bacteroidia bacterium]
MNGINAFYNAVYGKHRDENQFNWEYNSAPAGKAIYVLAEYKGEIVGTQAAIPYFLITGSGEKIFSAKSEDTLVSPAHRGKQIFEKMYACLFEECKKQNIRVIWGFTYADKPFKKLGFDIPYKACMGILVRELQQAALYFVSLAAKRSTKEQFGIYALSLFSKLKATVQLGFPGSPLSLVSGAVELSGAGNNYLHSTSDFGLLLDADFLNYRIRNNPYNASYNTLSYYQDNQLKIAMTYSVSENRVCYIIHLYLSPEVRSGLLKQFMQSILRVKEIKDSKVIRFWGFNHNLQNQKEVQLLSACGFTFINKGINLVWKTLDSSVILNPANFVLSRMASQGTD